MTPNRSSNGCGVQALSLHVGNPVSFQTGEVRLSWHGTIVSLCDIKRVSNPPTMLHLTSEFTISVRVERPVQRAEMPFMVPNRAFSAITGVEFGTHLGNIGLYYTHIDCRIQRCQPGWVNGAGGYVSSEADCWFSCRPGKPD